MKLNALTMAIGALAFGAVAAQAQAPSMAGPKKPHAAYTRNLPDSLMREAKVTEKEAIAVATKAAERRASTR